MGRSARWRGEVRHGGTGANMRLVQQPVADSGRQAVAQDCTWHRGSVEEIGQEIKVVGPILGYARERRGRVARSTC
jgi:hypothetical protein